MWPVHAVLLACLLARCGALSIPDIPIPADVRTGHPDDVDLADSTYVQTLSAACIQNSRRDALSLGGGAWSGSVLEQGTALALHFDGIDRALKKPRTLSGLQRVRREINWAWDHHWGQITLHSAYVAAVSRRTGQRLWAGRSVVAALLVKFRLTAFTSEVGESLRPLVAAGYVSAAYAVSWLYVSLDVVLRAGDEYAFRGRTWRVVRTLLFFGIFHSVATMLLPAMIIHAAVHRVSAGLDPPTSGSPHPCCPPRLLIQRSPDRHRAPQAPTSCFGSCAHAPPRAAPRGCSSSSRSSGGRRPLLGSLSSHSCRFSTSRWSMR